MLKTVNGWEFNNIEWFRCSYGATVWRVPTQGTVFSPRMVVIKIQRHKFLSRFLVLIHSPGANTEARGRPTPRYFAQVPSVPGSAQVPSTLLGSEDQTTWSERTVRRVNTCDRRSETPKSTLRLSANCAHHCEPLTPLRGHKSMKNYRLSSSREPSALRLTRMWYAGCWPNTIDRSLGSVGRPG